MAVHTQMRVDRPSPQAAAGRAAVSQGTTREPRVLVRLPDFRARHRSSPAAPGVRNGRDHFEGAPRPIDSPPPAKVHRSASWRHWATDTPGRWRLAWVGRVLPAAGRLLLVIWREPRLLMLILSVFGLQAAGVLALLNMGSGAQPIGGPGISPVPALSVEPSPLLPFEPAAPAPARPLQTPLSPPLSPPPTASPLPAPSVLPAPAVREPALSPSAPRLGDPNDKLPWEEWSNPSDKPSVPASNMSTGAGAANQPAALAGNPSGDALRAEHHTAQRPKRAHLKGTIEKLKSHAGSERSLPGLY